MRINDSGNDDLLMDIEPGAFETLNFKSGFKGSHQWDLLSLE